jgi:hypothetical protein
MLLNQCLQSESTIASLIGGFGSRPDQRTGWNCDSALRAQMRRFRTSGLRSMQEAAIGSVRVDPCSPIRAAPSSPQSRNLRVGPQLPLDIVTASPEDDASGAPGLELGKTFTQLLASACEGHLFGGGHVDEPALAMARLPCCFLKAATVTSTPRSRRSGRLTPILRLVLVSRRHRQPRDTRDVRLNP